MYVRVIHRQNGVALPGIAPLGGRHKDAPINVHVFIKVEMAEERALLPDRLVRLVHDAEVEHRPGRTRSVRERAAALVGAEDHAYATLRRSAEPGGYLVSVGDAGHAEVPGVDRRIIALARAHALVRADAQPVDRGPGQKARAAGAAWCSGGFRAEHGRDPLGPCPRHSCPTRTPSR